MFERRALFAEKFDHYRTMAVCEPRSSDAAVGALLCTPNDAACSAGVIFFNTAGYLGMCGHGAIGLAVTLAYLGRIKTRRTPVRNTGGRRRCRLDHRKYGSGRECRKLSISQRRSRRRCRSWDRPPAILRGAATGSFWSMGRRRRCCAKTYRRLRMHPQKSGARSPNLASPARNGRRDRSCGIFLKRRTGGADSRKLRVVPRRRLRSFPMRHGHQRKARLSCGGWQTRARRELDSGEHCRQPVRRDLPGR